jgi:hypothetical protein
VYRDRVAQSDSHSTEITSRLPPSSHIPLLWRTSRPNYPAVAAGLHRPRGHVDRNNLTLRRKDAKMEKSEQPQKIANKTETKKCPECVSRAFQWPKADTLCAPCVLSRLFCSSPAYLRLNLCAFASLREIFFCLCVLCDLVN